MAGARIDDHLNPPHPNHFLYSFRRVKSNVILPRFFLYASCHNLVDISHYYQPMSTPRNASMKKMTVLSIMQHDATRTKGYQETESA